MPPVGPETMTNVRMLIELIQYTYDQGEFVVGEDSNGRKTFSMINKVYKYQVWYDVNGLTIRLTHKLRDQWDEIDVSGISSGDSHGYIFLPLERENIARLKKLQRSMYHPFRKLHRNRPYLIFNKNRLHIIRKKN